MNDCYTASTKIPDAHIVVILARSEQHETPCREPLHQPLLAATQKVPLQNPPWLQVRQPKFNDSHELGRVVKVWRQFTNRQQVTHNPT